MSAPIQIQQDLSHKKFTVNDMDHQFQEQETHIVIKSQDA